jgi:large subunit ribosomal protein L30
VTSLTERDFLYVIKFILTMSLVRSATRRPLLPLVRGIAMPTSSASDASVAQAIVANTHFKITLRRSGISLGAKIQSTLVALGFHRRHQTVYHPHSPDIAGKILRVKELVEVSNVPAHMVRTKEQQTQDRKAKRGYKVVGSSKIL